MAVKICNSCGTALSEGTKFCTECGASIAVQETVTETFEEPVTKAVTAPNPVPVPTHVEKQPQITKQSEAVPGAGSKYAPISTLGYIGIILLMCVPFIGIIFVIIWALGGCRKVNKRNFARATLILMAVMVVISLIIGFVIKPFVTNLIEASGIGTLLGNTSVLSSQDLGQAAYIFKDDSNREDTSNFDTMEVLGALSGIDEGGLESLEVLGALSGLTEEGGLDALGVLGALSGMDALDALARLEALEGLDLNALSGMSEEELLSIFEDIQSEVGLEEESASSWPEGLRPYPYGQSKTIDIHRTDFSGSTKEEMQSYIEDLEKDGFAFRDFVGIGLSEADLLNMGMWLGNNGKLYVVLAYENDTVSINYTTENPGYFQ